MSNLENLPLRDPVVLTDDELKENFICLKVKRDGIDLKGHSVVQFLYDTETGKPKLVDYAIVNLFPGRTLELMVDKPFNFFDTCATCGRWVSFDLELKNDRIVGQAREACDFTEKDIEPHRVKIEVKSGKMVFHAGFFGGNFKDIDEEGYDPELSLNHIRTRYNFYKRQEENGVAYGQVGNTCPEVWFNETSNELIVGYGVLGENDESKAPEEGFKQVGRLITDLWAYTFADHDHLLTLRDGLEPEYGVIEVPNGLWEFTHYGDLPDFEPLSEDEPVIFARAKLLPHDPQEEKVT